MRIVVRSVLKENNGLRLLRVPVVVDVVSVVVSILTVWTLLSVDDDRTLTTSTRGKVTIDVVIEISVVRAVVVVTEMTGVKVRTAVKALVVMDCSVTSWCFKSIDVEVEVEVTVESPTVVNVVLLARTLCRMNAISGVVTS